MGGCGGVVNRGKYHDSLCTGITEAGASLFSKRTKNKSQWAQGAMREILPGHNEKTLHQENGWVWEQAPRWECSECGGFPSLTGKGPEHRQQPWGWPVWAGGETSPGLSSPGSSASLQHQAQTRARRQQAAVLLKIWGMQDHKLKMSQQSHAVAEKGKHTRIYN